MKYYFKVGRAKSIAVNEDDTFENLGFAILEAYHIKPYHLFMFTFSNGEETNSATPIGPMDDYRDVPIDSPINHRGMKIDEVMTMEYDYGTNWTRKVRLVKIADS